MCVWLTAVMLLLCASYEHVISQHITTAIISEDEDRLDCWLIASHSSVGFGVDLFFCVIVGLVG